MSLQKRRSSGEKLTTWVVPLGKAHANPLLDTREYEVQLEDGTYDSYFANRIAENLYAQCDAEGWEFNTVKDIIGHKTDGHAIAKRGRVLHG
jgi:hypothetical protein